MAVVLDPTPGGANANSYATLEEANAYHESILYPGGWATAADALKINALITATRLLDENINWVGYQSTVEQALAWPRVGAAARSGYAIRTGIIPTAVKDATAEYARLLIDAGAMPNSGGDVPAGLKMIKAGPVEIQYDPMLTSTTDDALPIAVISLINFLIESRAQQRTAVTLVRV